MGSDRLFCFISISKFETFENHFAKIISLSKFTLDADDYFVGTNKRTGRPKPTQYSAAAEAAAPSLEIPSMEHLTDDHVDRPNQKANNQKLCDEKEQSTLSLEESKWRWKVRDPSRKVNHVNLLEMEKL